MRACGGIRALYTPRISLVGLKTPVAGVSAGTHGAGMGWVQGGYRGWVYRVGYWVGTGRVLYRGTNPALRLHWYCQGPTDALDRASASTRALQTPAGVLRTPGLLALKIPALEPI